jgi:hypothetical protein
MRSPHIVDGRNVLDLETVRAASFVYDSIGHPASGVSEHPPVQASGPRAPLFDR